MAHPSPLKISLIQFPIQWENKSAAVEHIEQMFREVNPQSHIIILPEMFATGFTMNTTDMAETMDGYIVNWMRQKSIDMRKIICGSVIIKENDGYYNRLIWMLPNGQCHHYDKYHLFSKANEHLHYQPGGKKLIVQVNGWKIFLQTCYDLRFPVFARQSSELYDVMINVAQWPDMRSDAYVTLLKARAIENQCYVCAVNGYGRDGQNVYYSGHSSAYQYDGVKITEMVDEVGVKNISLSYDPLIEFREKFPFLEDRDKFIILGE